MILPSRSLVDPFKEPFKEPYVLSPMILQVHLAYRRWHPN